MKKGIIWFLSFVLMFSVFGTVHAQTDSEGYTFENETQRTTSVHPGDTQNVQMDESNGKVYYVWTQWDGAYWQIWTANSNIDGTGFSATQQTTGSIHSRYPNLMVKGSTVYYVYGRLNPRWEVFTATSNLDGSNFTPTQHTYNDGITNHYGYQLYVYDTKVYYTYTGYTSGPYQKLYTASANLDGTGWSTTQRIADGGYWWGMNVQTDGNKLLYAWQQYDGANFQLWTAESNLDGSSWSTTQRTSSAYDKSQPEFVINGSKMYFIWSEDDGTNDQIWTAEMNTDGTGWTPTKQTTSSFDSQSVEMRINGDQLYYVYREFDGTYYQIWLGYSDFDGSNFSTEQQSALSFSVVTPKFWIDETRVFYLWDEFHTTEYQMKTATGNYEIVDQELQTVTATVPSNLTFSIDGVTSGSACANSGSNASVTTTAATVPFGTYTGAQTKIACQTLTVTTNATNGFVVTVEQDDLLTSSGADTMKAFSGTYASPTTWASPPGSGTESYFGFTTDDTGYSNFQTSKYGSFGANDTPYGIMTGTDPVLNDETVVSYQLEVTALQEAGTYTNTVMYIATATF